MKTLLIAGALALASTSLCACAGTPLTGNPVADAKAAAQNTNPTQFFDNLNKFNQAAGQVCGGYGNLDWNPPLPPTGSVHVQCQIGQKIAVMPASTPAAAEPAK